MKTNTLTTYAGIAGKALFKGLFIFICGAIFCIVTLSIGIMLASKNLSGVNYKGGHESVLFLIPMFLALFSKAPSTAILILGSLVALYLYISISLGTILYQSIHGFWHAGAGNIISTKATSYVEGFIKKYGWLEKGGDKARLKLQLLQQLKDDTSVHSIERRVLRYGFKKLKLEDIDWANKENLSASVSAQLHKAISGVVKPSMKPFWILFFVQLAVLILALLRDS